MIDALQQPEAYEKQYQWAGWLAIAAAVLTFPLLILGFLVQPQWPKVAFPLLFVYVPVAVVQTGFALFALFWFRRLLNNRFHFHDTDALIVTIIIGSIVLSAFGLAAKIVVLFVPKSAQLAVALATLGPVILLGLPLAIVSIIFAVKLLRLQDDLSGMLRPFAYTTIAAGACFVTIILAPFGYFVDAVANVMLGMIFLRTLKAPAPVEFV